MMNTMYVDVASNDWLREQNKKIIQFYNIVAISLITLTMLMLVMPGIATASDGYSSHKLTDIFVTEHFPETGKFSQK